MAEIFGVSVKNIKIGTDHEGCAMHSADVWYKGKRLGRWSQNYMCGPSEFDFDDCILTEAVEKFRASDLVDPVFKQIVDTDILISKVIRLTEDERNFRKGLKKGFSSYIAQENGYRKGFWATSTDKKQIAGFKNYKDLTAQAQKVNIYTSLEDFKVS